jgi:hypothetical protein
MYVTEQTRQTLPPFEKKRSVARRCPCDKNNKDGKFVPFRGFTDKGYCHSCGKTFLPEIKKQEPYIDTSFLFPRTKAQETKKPKPIDFLPFESLKQSLCRYDENNFYLFLISLFGELVADDLVSSFYVGTAKLKGATLFPQIDINGNFRQAKVILYDTATGRRRKDIAPYHVARKILGEEANIQKCFFNEVGLSLFPHKPVAICESEKTAILASVFLPSFVWLATGGKNGVKWIEYDVCKVLKGRTVLLYPDLQAYETWCQAAEEIKKQTVCKIRVSDLLEKNATPEQREAQLDIADFLIRRCGKTGLALTNADYPVCFDYKIQEPII